MQSTRRVHNSIGATMGKISEYILRELKIIERECLEKGISASEWIEKYADEYNRKHRDRKKGNRGARFIAPDEYKDERR